VVVTVENQCGDDDDSALVSVLCYEPDVDLSSDSPVELGEAVHLTADVLVGTEPLTYTWDFGGAGSGIDLDTATPVYTYTDAGDYTVVVTVENQCGDDDDSALVSVLCYEPDVDLSSDSPVELGEAVHLTADVLVGTEPLTYTWDFGGPGHGVGLDSATPVYTYTDAGDYTVAVTVENPCGEDSASTQVVVSPVCTNVTDVELTLLSAGPIYPGEEVEISADLVPDGAAPPYSYTVDFGDGTAPILSAGYDDPLALHYTYTVTGTFSVEVLVWNCTMTEMVSDTLAVDVSGRPASHYVYLPLVIRR
jgi:PKD repeat protein